MRVLEELARRAALGETNALATVVETVGSTPAQGSMRMLVGAEGRITGTVGGGHVEASIEKAAQAVLETGQHQMLSFTFDDDMADEGGLICGGTIKVLVERVEAARKLGGGSGRHPAGRSPRSAAALGHVCNGHGRACNRRRGRCRLE